jgi:carbon monoxide dehydrogenase subunit G
VIDIHERFEVPSDPAKVWQVLSNPREVISCVPGASITRQRADGSYDAQVVIRFGPTPITFQARVALELDEDGRTGQIAAQGKDNLGGTRFKATTAFGVTPRSNGNGSVVAIDGAVDVSGRLASLVESAASVVVRRLSGEFAERLAARCG